LLKLVNLVDQEFFMNLTQIGQQARHAFKHISLADSETRRKTVPAIADKLEQCTDEIRAANDKDIQIAHAGGMRADLVDRLTLTPSRLKGLVADVRALAELPDPVGEVFDARTLPNGLKIHRQRVPLGVLGVIYESRPNVTIDVAALAIKTGNAAVLRGGKETIHSNVALVSLVHAALRENALPAEVVQFIDDPDRNLVAEMLRLNDYIDVIIPRGGNGLHQFCRQNATIPVITGGIGVCHIFVDETANLDAALPVIFNAKTQRPSVCNSLDTVLVHEKVAAEFLPRVVEHLAPAGVTFRAEPGAALLLNEPTVSPAGPDDFHTEWLSLILGLKVVPGLDAAIEHIYAHSTFHSDGILTQTQANAERFIREVDSAAVFVNASTRFNDGAQLGLGAEVAVSTQRLHARGPMGLPELTSYKWVVVGDYTVRA
jgi:glutamate-5-semialdehyde dehydrogenase